VGTGDEKKKRRSDDDYGSVGQWRDEGWETAGRRLTGFEDVRPDRDTEKRVAPSEEEEAGLPWGRRFPRSRASRRGASSPTSLTPIPVHWPVGEKKGKIYLFALVLRCRVSVGCWRSTGERNRFCVKFIFTTGGVRVRKRDVTREIDTILLFFRARCSPDSPAKAITPARRRLHFDGWRARRNDRFFAARCSNILERHGVSRWQIARKQLAWFFF